MLNIVDFSYVPNSAATNRLLAFVTSIPSDIFVKVFFLLPDDKFSKWKVCRPNVQVIYCWDEYSNIFFRCKMLKYLIFRKSLKVIYRQLYSGDVVYCYNVPSYIRKLRKPGVKYYAERTESPLVTSSPSRIVPFSLDSHLKICKELDGLFVISTALSDYYISQGVEPNKVHIINMTIDVNRFAGITKSSEIKHKYIAYCGTISNAKDGVDKLIRSFSLVTKKYPNLYLYIIGKFISDKNNDNYVLAESLGIMHKIVFTGSVTSDKVPQLLKDAEICVLNRPDSLQAQCGFPTKLGEYLMSENPVVVTCVGDIPKFLKDGESALLASPHDDSEFAEKIIWAIEHQYEARRIGLRGAEVARKYFNAQIEAGKMLNVMFYEENKSFEEN